MSKAGAIKMGLWAVVSLGVGIWRWPMEVCASVYPLSGCNAGCDSLTMDWLNYQAGYRRLDTWSAVRMAATIFADGLQYSLSEVRFSSRLLQGRKA